MKKAKRLDMITYGKEREREKERGTTKKKMKLVVSKSIQTTPVADFWDRIISFMGFWYKMEC